MTPPLFVGLTHHTVNLLERAGVEAVLFEQAQPSEMNGRSVILAPSAAKPEGVATAAAHRLRKMGAQVAVVPGDILGGCSDVADFLETAEANGKRPNLEMLAALTQEKARAPAQPSANEEQAVQSDEVVALEIGELLARDFPPKDPLLSPWLRRQDLAMVFAERGVGKTHFCLALAYAIACGGKFMKWEAPQPRRVLYIDGEMPGAAIKGRLSALVEAFEQEPPEGYFRIVTPDVQSAALPDLATLAGQAAIGHLLRDAELIVLDNLSALTRAGVENEGESWVPMATWALARRREGRTVLFVHHGGKNGAQRGTSRREDLLDVSIRLKRPGDYRAEQGARFEVEFTKARGLFGEDARAVEATLTPGHNGGLAWTWRNVEGATAERVAELEALGMKAGEIAAELGIHRSTVYRALGKPEGKR